MQVKSNQQSEAKKSIDSKTDSCIVPIVFINLTLLEIEWREEKKVD